MPLESTFLTPEPAMIREIHEQPASLMKTLDHYVADGRFRSESCDPIRRWLNGAERILVAASGSSRHAGLAAELLIERLTGLAVDVEYASEYAYRNDLQTSNAAVVVISQSGETSDTLAALRKANTLRVPTLSITNVPSSSMSQEASVSFPTLAGTELAVPATKSFTAQLLNVALLALLAAESRRSLRLEEIAVRLQSLSDIPALIEAQLATWYQNVKPIAESLHDVSSMLFLGRGPHYPIAREGALKLKESAYLHAEGYPSGELKHGPNALLSDNAALVIIATVDHRDEDSVDRYRRTLQLMKDVAAQGARIVAVANKDDDEVRFLAAHVIPVNSSDEIGLLISEVVPLQMLAYVTSVSRGIDVDRPRNLSKAVLVD